MPKPDDPPQEIPLLEGQLTIEDVIEGGDNGLHEEALPL